jgi:hypothetical protein
VPRADHRDRLVTDRGRVALGGLLRSALGIAKETTTASPKGALSTFGSEAIELMLLRNYQRQVASSCQSVLLGWEDLHDGINHPRFWYARDCSHQGTEEGSLRSAPESFSHDLLTGTDSGRGWPWSLCHRTPDTSNTWRLRWVSLSVAGNNGVMVMRANTGPPALPIGADRVTCTPV